MLEQKKLEPSDSIKSAKTAVEGANDPKDARQGGTTTREKKRRLLLSKKSDIIARWKVVEEDHARGGIRIMWSPLTLCIHVSCGSTRSCSPLTRDFTCRVVLNALFVFCKTLVVSILRPPPPGDSSSWSRFVPSWSSLTQLVHADANKKTTVVLGDTSDTTATQHLKDISVGPPRKLLLCRRVCFESVFLQQFSSSSATVVGEEVIPQIILL